MASVACRNSSSRSTGIGHSITRWLKRNAFILLLILSTICGYGLGLALKSLHPSRQTIHLVGFPGQLVLRAFFMIIVPLLFCSLVLGVSSLRKGGDAKMVVLTIAFFLGLSTFSAIMGAVAGHVAHPGWKIVGDSVHAQSEMSGRKGVILDSILDLLWNAVPSNIMQATFMKEYTDVEIINASELPIKDSDDSNENNTRPALIYKKSIQQNYGVNFMGLLTFSILFGSALAALGDKGEHLYQVINQLNAVVMSIMNYFLNLLPIGMFFWMCREGMEGGAHVQLFSYLGVFLATAFGCIIFHQLVLLPCLYLIVVRRNPFTYYANLLPAILTAFGTASSAATLPATLRCAEEVNRLSRSITRFVLPLGMVVHMNGGTFYTPYCTIFLAQLEGIELGAAETVIVCLVSILLLISAPATTGGGNPIYLLTAMAAVGIERPQYVSIIISLDWLMERFRTVMNVVADSYVAAMVEKLSQKRLASNEDAVREDAVREDAADGEVTQV